MSVTREEFIQELKKREAWLLELFQQERYRRLFGPEPLQQAVYSYLGRPAKRFRPGILLFCAGATGGKEEQALFAAASVEVYHTWTLVHDDIIDNDPKRRGLPTVHEEFRQKSLSWGYPETEAVRLGRDIAILAGDLQHAWSVRLLLDSMEAGVPLTVIFDLVKHLETEVTTGLVKGEALDVLFARQDMEELSEKAVLEMLELKTGVLFQYAAMAGASIGLGQTAAENKLIESLGRFARGCGIAFQLQDDILGITGDEKALGKPVGSDIREGKRTTIVLKAYQNAGSVDKEYLRKWLGNPAIPEQEVIRIRRILTEYNGISYTRELAESIVTQATAEIASLPESGYKELLLAWAKYVINREF
ncbi:MAG: polyprenyl synthetase family protein [Bacillota bacterium]